MKSIELFPYVIREVTSTPLTALFPGLYEIPTDRADIFLGLRYRQFNRIFQPSDYEYPVILLIIYIFRKDAGILICDNIFFPMIPSENDIGSKKLKFFCLIPSDRSCCCFILGGIFSGFHFPIKCSCAKQLMDFKRIEWKDTQ